MANMITLSDNDILSIDESTGNIVVSRDSVPSTLTVRDTITVHYIEDIDNISHEYSILNITDSDVSMKWVSRLEESLLTEAPLSNLFKKQQKKADKANLRDAKKARKNDENIVKNAKKLLARDMGPEGRNWSFYLANGYQRQAKPINYTEARKLYDAMGDNMTPQIANAIVTDEDGMIVRRGMEDLYGDNIKLDDTTKKIKDKYMLPWTDSSVYDSSDDEKKSSKSDEEEAKYVKKTVDGGVDTENPDKDEPTDHHKKDSTESKKTDDEDKKEDSKSDKEGSEKAKTGNKDDRYDLGISSKSYGHFLKLIYLLRPKVFDAFDKPVDVSNIKTLGDRVKYNNLGDFTIEVAGTKVPAVDWIKKAVKNKVIMEKLLRESPVVTLDDSSLMNPDDVNIRDIIKTASEKEQAEQQAKKKQEAEDRLRQKSEVVIEKLNKSLSRGDSAEDTLEILFDELVPRSGAAESVAGELVRAMMRLLYRDYNDGDKFFESYGLETCGSYAGYLYDHGFDEEIQEILDDALRLSDDDDAYTEALQDMGSKIISSIKEDDSLLWTVNEEDSGDYPFDYIEQNQPRYEIEIPCSERVVELIEREIINSWDLIRYVDDNISWDAVYEGASASRPWGHHDVSVTVKNLTKDGYTSLEDVIKFHLDGWWEDLVADHADELIDEDEEDTYEDEYED